MKQATFAVAIEVQSARLAMARADVAALQKKTGTPLPGAGPVVLDGVESLHFLSIVIAEDSFYDPLLIIDVNCDGEARHLWPQLTDRIGKELLKILSHTRPARGGRAKEPPGCVASVPAYLELHTSYPSALHHGHRGLTRNRILNEARLIEKAECKLDAMLACPKAQKLTPEKIAVELREATGYPPTPPSRYVWWERIRVLWRKDAVMTFARVILAAALFVAVWYGVHLLWMLAAQDEDLKKFVLRYRIGLLLGLIGLPLAAIGGMLWQLRTLETTDPVLRSPRIAPGLRASLHAAEPGIRPGTMQSHLAAVVHVKPGWFRTLALRLVLFVMKYKIWLINIDGYFQTMRTIHFIQWVMIDNGSRVLFLSNYDGSWDSYLDDFVEKASEGLTAAWSSTIGFPETRWIRKGGAAKGDAFKAWTLGWQHPTLFFYQAYPMSTVDRIERCAAIAEGLYAGELTGAAARDWALQL